MIFAGFTTEKVLEMCRWAKLLAAEKYKDRLHAKETEMMGLHVDFQSEPDS